jgi:hypothetical protein
MVFLVITAKCIWINMRDDLILFAISNALGQWKVTSVKALTNRHLVYSCFSLYIYLFFLNCQLPMSGENLCYADSIKRDTLEISIYCINIFFCYNNNCITLYLSCFTECTLPTCCVSLVSICVLIFTTVALHKMMTCAYLVFSGKVFCSHMTLQENHIIHSMINKNHYLSICITQWQTTQLLDLLKEMGWFARWATYDCKWFDKQEEMRVTDTLSVITCIYRL